LNSGDKSGIVLVILFFLWGTLVAEPLHIYTHYVRKITETAGETVGIRGVSIGMTVVITVIMVIVSCLLIKISETKYSIYIATAMTILTGIGYIINSIIDHDMDLKLLVTTALMLLVLAVFHIFHMDQFLKTAGDVYICAHIVYLVTNLMLVPVSKLAPFLEKVLYITRYRDTDLSLPLAGTLSIPQAVWGAFIAIIALIPTAYLMLTRRRA